MEFALKAENVSIRYITGDFKDIGIKEYVSRKATHNYHVNEFMAVDGVSFTLERGDMLGIVGTNGAGKSTLLKAVAGIMEPTKGKITANGEVAALLELGSGFDGDLTVKENAYLRGAMLGYTKEFMNETYDHIIDFAELREFENRPFKQLSSGMKSRLAFSIASLVKPDILILDEVLSVGDGAFQEKSAKKMREIISQGATTILVSHSLGQIRELCNKVLWLDHGKQVAFGDVNEVCDLYERYLNGEKEIALNLLNRLNSPEEKKFNCIGEDCTLKEKKKFFEPLSTARALVVAIFLTFVVFSTGMSINIADIIGITNSHGEATTVLMYNETPMTSVTYRGAAVDGKWVSSQESILNQGNWIFDEEQDTYTSIDATPLIVKIPQGKQRTITFNVGPEEGEVCVKVGEETLSFNLKQSEVVETGLPFALQQNTFIDNGLYGYILLIAIFIVFFVMCYIWRGEKIQKRSFSRELWGDILRIICCFVIVLLHCTCNVFERFREGEVAFLLINAFTAFAVPCFYMISGAYLLRKPQGVFSTLKNRIPKIAIPTLFWGVIYLLLSGQIEGINFVKLIFQNKEPHLWFMYNLFGIYMLLPFLSKLYNTISIEQKVYGLILILVIPTCIYDGGRLLGIWVPNPSFVVFWPDLGIFLLGGVLWELREKIKIKPKYFYVMLFLLGFAITVFGTMYVSNVNNTADKSFISAIGSMGNLIMAASMFSFVLSCKDALEKKKTSSWALLIHEIGTVTMGVYLIHVIFLKTLVHTGNNMIPFYSNSGSLLNMVASAIAYFMISTVVCLSAKRMRIINKLF